MSLEDTRPPEQVELARELFFAGKSYRDIGNELKKQFGEEARTYSQVCRWADDDGWKALRNEAIMKGLNVVLETEKRIKEEIKQEEEEEARLEGEEKKKAQKEKESLFEKIQRELSEKQGRQYMQNETLRNIAMSSIQKMMATEIIVGMDKDGKPIKKLVPKVDDLENCYFDFKRVDVAARVYKSVTDDMRRLEELFILENKILKKDTNTIGVDEFLETLRRKRRGE